LKEFSSVIHAQDIKLSSGVTLIAAPLEIIASVAEPRKIEEEVVVAPADLSTIEVAKKGKEAKEGEVPAEGAVAEASASAKATADKPKKEEKKK
jgi:hypothetical protein